VFCTALRNPEPPGNVFGAALGRSQRALTRFCPCLGSRELPPPVFRSHPGIPRTASALLRSPSQSPELITAHVSMTFSIPDSAIHPQLQGTESPPEHHTGRERGDGRGRCWGNRFDRFGNRVHPTGREPGGTALLVPGCLSCHPQGTSTSSRRSRARAPEAASQPAPPASWGCPRCG
jgi:hypothetical protein